MSRAIGDDAIKISLIQTLPGEEFPVAMALEKACNLAKIDKFAIFKGFGSYDIIFIHAWENFSSVLTKFGPISGIIKTSKSFCYHHSAGNSEDFFLTLKRYACAAITIIKVKIDDSLGGYGSERAIVDEMSKQKTPSFFFGTLGWSELITVTADNDLSQIITNCLIPSYTKTSNYVQKTYSIIALNYQMLPYKDSLPNVASFTTSLKCLDKPVPAEIEPIITVTCVPGATDDVLSFWPAENYEISDLIGKEDLQIIPKKNKVNWTQLIHDLFIFRQKFKNVIHSTTTYISFKGQVDRKCIARLNPQVSVDYEFQKLKEVFEEKALGLATSLNTLNGLIKNPIVCDAFQDMANYHKYIIDFGSQIKPKKRTNFASQVTDTINKSAEIRLYGTYGTIEDNTGQFKKISGGVQRSIQAISCLPRLALNRTLGKLEYEWNGFISISNHQFYNSNEVVHVPIDSLWNPKTWWAINHEVAHIIINNVVFEDGSGLVDDSNKELKMFLASKNNPDHWLQLVIELAAEYIGYELGFYSNYDLFLKNVWFYLKRLAPKNLLYSPLSIYAVRTYFVRLFESLFITYEMKLEDASDYNQIYEEIINHIEEIERVEGDNSSDQFKAFVNDKYILAAYYAPKFKSLLPWMENILAPAIAYINLRGDHNEILCSNTNEVISSLESGIVWDGDIKYPEAILYKIYQKDQVSFKMSIATILSFWNQSKRSR